MKIAMVCDGTGPLAALSGEHTDGSSIHVAGLARAMSARTHRVTVYAPSSVPPLERTVDVADGLWGQHVPTTADPGCTTAYVTEVGERLAAEWSADPPDVVHAQPGVNARFALAGASRLGIPVVQTVHASAGNTYGEPALPQGASRGSPGETVETAKQAAMVVTTSTQARQEMRASGVPGERCVMVPYGIDTTLFRPEGAVCDRGRNQRIVTTGRLGSDKDIDTVVRALAYVPDAELVVAGGPPSSELDDDPDAARIRGVAVEAGVAERVRLLGWVPHREIPSLLRSADLAVDMARWQPFGLATVEAMACGAPVIASSVGGHLDTMVHGVTGRLIPPADPAALARRIRNLMNDPVARETYGIAAADRAAARYGWPMVAGQLEGVYHKAYQWGNTPGPVARADTVSPESA
ncbi:glycosyltransferase involved in cell wall biosynthesis [Haloactinospora alba]|uniref:Glycosyltransferase involved in cell wall biosynthesis n=1 Tax=Haloactinospora alba TaxID=405555 RepID=A0A543NJ42_9ACTN|nr:glycosyltransferase [Haloactinospora alba]TQN31770.1 glycosyltransferase involved in cell wall biosynthesis [Haloactinospora alba]